MKCHLHLPIALLLFGSITIAHADSTNLPARVFSHPDRIRYDAHCVTIDGKDVFIYSGAFHYFRCPKELWRDRFEKIKMAGFNCVETYAAWNWSEQQMPAGTNDFSRVNVSDLDEWLTMAESYGFYTIVRPGPYICAEWATGGFPEWLLTKKPAQPLRTDGWLRSDDPVFLAWSKHWYDAVCPVIAKHQITRKAPGQPGVILVQMENEYDYAKFSDQVKINHVKALAQAAQADGIDVPLFTCWTRQVRGSSDPVLRQIFDCCNFYPRWNVEGEVRGGVSKLRAEQPDAPLATTELQGGWFARVGDKLSEDQDGVTAAQINNVTMYALQMGDTIMNYYMLFGGSNPGDWTARNLASTYDYNAPIRECGGIGDRYQRVQAIGAMLKEHGARLARAEAIDCEAKATQNDVSVVERRALDGSRYLFIRTSQHQEPREGTATVRESGSTNDFVFDYQLEPFGAKVLYLPPDAADLSQGEWLPKPVPNIERPPNLPAPVPIASVKMQGDPGPSRWTILSPGEMLAQIGDYSSDFIFYQAKISSRTATNLLVKYPSGDAVLATINGKHAEPVSSSAAGSVFALPKGSSQLQFLYENHGFANGGNDMERAGGLTAQFVASPFGDGRAITGWRMHDVDSTSKRPEVATDFIDDDWSPVSVDESGTEQLTGDRTAVFRATVEVDAADLATGQMLLNFEHVDDLGWVYVNGKSVGKTTEWWRAYSFDVTKQLQPGRNIIAVIVKNTGGGGGIAGPVLARMSDTTPVPLSAFAHAGGVQKQWWKPDLDDRHWKTVSVNGSSSNDSRLTWYRMEFNLPAPDPHAWVPWRLHLEATGNGFVYLNGHALGRYWEVGPQRDFFLPECWLHFGPGQTNNVTLDLRPTDHLAAIQSAVVEPYETFAERR